MARQFPGSTPVMVLAAFLASASATLADPIVITSGQTVITNALTETGVFSFSGRNFSVSGNVMEGGFPPSTLCWNAPLPACAPGAVLPINGFWGGLSVGFTATLNGVTYTGPSWADGSNMLLSFKVSALLPAWTGSDTSVVTPFTFAGELAHTVEGAAGFTQPLLGRGTATVFLSPFREPDAGERWQVRTVNYNFASAEPIPEPATLLLLGGGMAASALLRRKARPRP